MKAFAWFVQDQSERLKSDRCVDEVSQNGLSGHRIAGEIGIEGLCEESLTKPSVPLYTGCDCFLKCSCECHTASIVNLCSRFVSDDDSQSIVLLRFG